MQDTTRRLILILYRPDPIEIYCAAMRVLAAAAACAILALPLAAQQREPIIDVHMHALAADAQGPPPLGMCTPFPEFPAWDPATSYGVVFTAA
jgi:hypothetical protein